MNQPTVPVIQTLKTLSRQIMDGRHTSHELTTIRGILKSIMDVLDREITKRKENDRKN